MNEYFIYLRKSREDAEQEKLQPGSTLARHKKILLETAGKLGLSITKIFEEIRSGETIAARPVIQEVLSEVEAGKWAGCLVMEVERLARGDTIDQGIMMQAFKYSGTKIITPYKTYDPTNEADEEYFEFGLFMSRREYKTINKRLQSGRLASVKEGKYIGNIPPYGYRRVKLEQQKGYTLEPIEQAAVVRTIFLWKADGMPQGDGTTVRVGTTRIAKRLMELGIPAPNGGSWTAETITTILHNPVYTGRNKWGQRKAVKSVVNGEITVSRPRATDYPVFPGLWPALIDDALFEKVQGAASPVPPHRHLENPLAGLVLCARCGRAMVRRPYSNSMPPSLICTTIGCNNVSATLSLVEERLLFAIEKWLDGFEIDDTAIPSAASPATETGILDISKKELRKLELQKQKTFDLLEQGVYTTEIFLERTARLDTRMEQLKAAIEHSLEELKEQEAQREALPLSVPTARTVLEAYRSASTPEEKNALLRQVLQKVEYSRESGGRWQGARDNFNLILYPKFSVSHPD